MSKSKGAYGYGQAYVALSRVKKMSALNIVKYNRMQIKADPNVASFMTAMAMKNIGALQLGFTGHHQAGTTITHQNIESCASNQKDIDVHEELHASDVVCLTETHLRPGQCWPLHKISSDAFTIYRMERSAMSGGGIAICVKSDISSCCIAASSIISCEFIHVLVNISQPLHILCCYKRPISSLEEFTDILTTYIQNNVPSGLPCVIVGDFNNDLLNEKESRRFLSLMSGVGFTQIIEEFTTDRGTLVDHVYVQNVDVLKKTVRDCYYSYHDTVTVTIS
jgi:exonuclease III